MNDNCFNDIDIDIDLGRTFDVKANIHLPGTPPEPPDEPDTQNG